MVISLCKEEWYTPDQNKMSLKKARTTSPDASRSSTPQWLQRAFIVVGLLVLGSWTASEYSSDWTSQSILDYMRSTISGEATKPYSSLLTEPWSKVSYRIHFPYNPAHILQSGSPKNNHAVKQLQRAAAELLLRLPLTKSLSITTASVTSNAPDLMFLWIGTIPSLATLVWGSH